jgi:hypothetical protein
MREMIRERAAASLPPPLAVLVCSMLPISELRRRPVCDRVFTRLFKRTERRTGVIRRCGTLGSGAVRGDLHQNAAHGACGIDARGRGDYFWPAHGRGVAQPG